MTVKQLYGNHAPDKASYVTLTDGNGNLVVVDATTLPTGAATSAKQDAVIGSASGGTAATSSELVGGTYSATLPTLSDGQQNALKVGTRGSLSVTLFAQDSANAISQGGYADATTSPANALRIVQLPLLFNGTTSDRWRSSGATGEAAVGGLTAGGAADTGNPVKVGGKFNTTLPTYSDGQRTDTQSDTRGGLYAVLKTAGGTAGAVVGTTADAAINGNNGLFAQTYNQIFNGTTWDRWRSSGATGEAAVGGLTAAGASDAGNPVKVGGKYNSTKPTYTDGNRGDAQMSASGALVVALGMTGASAADGSSNTIAQPQSVSGGTAHTGLGNLGVVNSIFNGTTWDRWRSGGVLGMAGVVDQASPSGGWSFSNITTSTTTTVKSGAGRFRRLIVGIDGTVASSVAIYDNTAASGTTIATINTLSAVGVYEFDIQFSTGLTVVTTGSVAPNVTVVYK